MDPVLIAMLSDLPFYWFSSPVWLIVGAFQLWMFIDAVRQGEWVWAIFIWVFPGLNAMLYYFLVYRSSAAAARGFQLPGAADRRRIRELQAQIHHLDKAHHHYQLGDIYFQQGKFPKAEACYRASLEREPDDIDARAHLGQCLLRQNRAAEARPLLEGVVAQNPKHDYGYTLMALAECLAALGDKPGALKLWQEVTASHSYPRAKVQLAELYIDSGQPRLARAELQEVVADDVHAPAFQRRRDRVWIRRARSLLRKLGTG
ncbi:MAG: tetratricopeptide repeat protein [Verrucomicrobiota bacterium]